VKSRDDAIKEGATAPFEEKYGETVRVIRIGDFSMELCGGTHVKNTGKIGSFYIASEGSLASGVRRIEALTGKGAILHARKLDGMIKHISRIINTEPDRIADKIESLIGELDQKEKEIGRLKEGSILSQVDEAIRAAHEKDGVKIISMYVPDGKAEDLRRVTDIIRDKVKTCVVLVGSREDDKGMLVAAVSRDIQAVFHAGKIIKKITEAYEGKGGGGPQIAQGGIPGNKVLDALRHGEDLIHG